MPIDNVTVKNKITLPEIIAICIKSNASPLIKPSTKLKKIMNNMSSTTLIAAMILGIREFWNPRSRNFVSVTTAATARIVW